jgi:beta-lactamase class C
MRWSGKTLLALVAMLAIPYFWAKKEVSEVKRELKYLPENLENPHTRELINSFDQFFKTALKGSRTPGAAVVIIKDTSILYMRGLGIKNSRVRDSVDVNTVFRIGSLSKGFAGVLSGIMVQEGRFGWNDRVKKYYPDFQLSTVDHTDNATITHLLSHTTGMPYHTYSDLVEGGWTLRNIAARLSRVRPAAPLGKMYNYQNAVFSLIEEVMQTTTHHTYQQLLRDRIFEPAGMETASVTYREMLQTKDKAFPHDNLGGRMDITAKYYNTAAAGGVNASINDMGKWLQVLLGNRPDIIKSSTLDHVFNPLITTSNERRVFPHWSPMRDAYYALGWRVLDCGADTLIYHGGYVNGYRSELAFDRKEKVAICVLFNAPSPIASSCIPTFFDMYRFHADEIKEWETSGKFKSALSYQSR